jgi:hypothetical protein
MCPNCQSEDVQTLQVVFDEGTSRLDGRQTGGGVGWSPGHGVGVGVGGGKIRGTTQSVLAQKAAPPKRKSVAGGVVVAIIGLVLLIGLVSAGGGAIAAGIIIGLILMALGVYAAYRANGYNASEWPGLYEQWRKSWMCRKCGTVFVHS